MSPSVPSTAQLGGALALAVLAIGTSSLLILLADPLPPLWIAAGRVTVTGLALLAIGARSLGPAMRSLRAQPRLLGALMVAGVLLAVHFATWVASLGLTSVLRANAFIATQPIFAGLLGGLIGDKVSPRLYLGTGVAVCGVLVAASGAASDGAGSFVGDGLAAIGALTAAAYLLVGRAVRAGLPLTVYLGLVHLLAAAVLGVAIVVSGETTVPTSVGLWQWLAVLGCGLVPGLLGHGMLNWSVRHVPVHVVSLAILLEPVAATLLVVAVLGRVVTGTEIGGAAILLAGVGVGMWQGRAKQPSG